MTIDDRPASEALHRAVLDSALDCIVTINAEGCIVEWNPAAERTFGWRKEEVVGRRMSDVIVPPHLLDQHRTGFARYLDGGEPRILDRRVEVEAVRRDGRVFPVELTITRIDVAGPVMLTGHIRDITDRKLAEEELRRSRARLVEAGDAARRRLERDLHDGAQQRLIALGLDLQVARSTLSRDPAAAADLLETAIADLGAATDELRELARGIHPAILTERGLGPALGALARRSPIPVKVELIAEERPPAAVEATAYFVVSEALANAARYSQADSVEVAVLRSDEVLVVAVTDDGVGGAAPGQGSGLAGLIDRVAALDGTLVVTSPSGGGTRVEAVIPCG
ncbi:MAG TPA: PAS domain S-box protein [Solirubrobacteraceae bacterium]